MSTTVTTRAVVIEVDPVSDIVVTEIQQDTVAGDYVREVRIFGEVEAGQANAPQVVVLKLRGASPTDLKLASPASAF